MRNPNIIKQLQDLQTRTIRPAPLFDHGFSLVFSCHDAESVKRFDVMEDRPVQSFVGSRSARKNLELIPKVFFETIPTLKETDREYLLADLEGILTEGYSDVIWSMIWGRWKIIESIHHS